jgi:hypothetical protein
MTGSSAATKSAKHFTSLELCHFGGVMMLMHEPASRHSGKIGISRPCLSDESIIYVGNPTIPPPRIAAILSAAMSLQHIDGRNSTLIE